MAHFIFLTGSILFGNYISRELVIKSLLGLSWRPCHSLYCQIQDKFTFKSKRPRNIRVLHVDLVVLLRSQIWIVFLPRRPHTPHLLCRPCTGGNGYINDYPMGRFLRDAKLYEIGAGTSEIRRLIIGRSFNAMYKWGGGGGRSKKVAALVCSGWTQLLTRRRLTV